jgi:hypothetical protein
MSRDVIAELRAQDPARRARLDTVDPGALVALREGITMTDRTGTTPTTPERQKARRMRRRGVLATGLGVALVGGGWAYAASQLWSDEEGAATNNMGVECQEVFGQGYGEEGGTVAITLTGDPVADCQAVRAQEGLVPLADPVAFRLDGTMYVTPRDQVPDGADLLEIDPAEAAVYRELQASLNDVVDGGRALCLSADDAVGWVESEFDRLGLSGWSVEVVHGSDEEGKYPCSDLYVGEKPRTAEVFPGLQPQVEDVVPAEQLTALRSIGEQCMTVDEAQEIAEDAFGAEAVDGQLLQPITRVVDPGATCARVDMEAFGGGIVVVTVYGPTSVG